MSKDKAVVPKLRFPEFLGAGDWEQKYIEDFFNVGSSKRVLQQDWTAQGVPFYRTRELVSLSKNEPFSNEIFISKSLFEEITQKYGAPREGDFLVSGVGTLGISYLVKKGDEFYFKDGNVIWFSRKGGVSSSFFKYCFESDVIQDQILKQASVSTVGTYTIQNAKITNFFCPPTEKEQQKIAECLSSVDELMAAQAGKVDALKANKKGLMQQLFPREGETQPRLRLPEFQNAGEWKRRKLGSLFVIGSGRDYKHLAPGTIPVYGSGGYMLSVNNFLHDGESVCIGRKGTIDRPMFLSGKFWTVDTLFFTHSFTDCIPKFMFSIFENIEWRKHNEAGGVPSLSKTIIEKIETAIPSIPEQQRIADLLTSLDGLIAAQTQKLEALKTHKKGLMQQLFPLTDEVCV